MVFSVFLLDFGNCSDSVVFSVFLLDFGNVLTVWYFCFPFCQRNNVYNSDSIYSFIAMSSQLHSISPMHWSTWKKYRSIQHLRLVITSAVRYDLIFISQKQSCLNLTDEVPWTMSNTTGILQEPGTAYPSQACVAHIFCFCVVFYVCLPSFCALFSMLPVSLDCL